MLRAVSAERAAELAVVSSPRLTGKLGYTLRHCAGRTQRHIRTTGRAARDPPGDHCPVVTDPHVIGVRVSAPAFAAALIPDRGGAPATQQRANSRVAAELSDG